MSSRVPRPVRSAGPIIMGNTAPALDSAAAGSASAPLEGPARRDAQRTLLSVVPFGAHKRRAPFVIFCFAILALALVAVLVVNVSLSSGQYKVIELSRQQVQLEQENQMLTQQVEGFEAPQNLAARASDLGMVKAVSPGAINVKSLKVSGNPKPAEREDEPDALIPAAQVPGEPAEDWARAPQATGGAAAEDAAQSAQDSSAAESAHAAPQAGVLHGGTLEAPQQKAGQ